MFTILFDMKGFELNKCAGVFKTMHYLAKELLTLQDKDFKVEIGINFKTCHRIKENILNLPQFSLGEDTDIFLKAGDVYFLPFCVYDLEINDILRIINQGLCVIPFLHDIIPITHPELCVQKQNDFFAWCVMISMMNTGLICNSKFSAMQYLEKFHYHKPIGFIHLGVEENVDLEEMELPKGKNVLMVSTIEPRKKYGETLSVFERIWGKTKDINLIIVGNEGWDNAVVERIKNHNLKNVNLFHYQKLSENKLHFLYKHCDLFLFSSEVEGFGLGVVEAAKFGTPLLLRDIPVFREIAGEFATYFDNFENLDEIILNFDFKPSTGIKINSWNNVANDLTKLIWKIRLNFLKH